MTRTTVSMGLLSGMGSVVKIGTLVTLYVALWFVVGWIGLRSGGPVHFVLGVVYLFGSLWLVERFYPGTFSALVPSKK